MAAIQAISRLPIDHVSPKDSNPSRVTDLFQNHFDRKLDSARSRDIEPSNDSSKIENTNKSRPIERESKKSNDDQIKPIDDPAQQTNETKPESTAEAESSDSATADDESMTKDDAQAAQDDSKTPENTDEIDDQQLAEAALMATVATPVAQNQVETTVSAETPIELEDSTTEMPTVVSALASTTQTESKKPVEAGKSVAKTEGQTELPEFQGVESTTQSEMRDSNQESGGEGSESSPEFTAKPQASIESDSSKSVGDSSKPAQVDPFRAAFDATQPKSNETSSARPVPNLQTLARDPEVVKNNVENIVSSVRTQLLPRGGNMQMRLDPPELGALTISLKLIDGRMTASFTAENDDATRMLSQNLGQLKSTLEASGVQVQRIDVKTATEANTNSNSRDEGSKDQQKQSDGSWQQSEQQRREMVNKMWRRYAYGADELDLVA